MYLLEEMGNMLTLVKKMMAISVTTAACERGFSLMNLEKISQTTQMRPDTLEQFNPEPALMLLLDDSTEAMLSLAAEEE